jgi:UV DNA damage repair endonuclease
MYNLCCISNELKEQGIKFQTMTWKRFNQLVDSEGQQFALNHCHDNGWGYRVSSSLFPCLTHPAFQFTVEDVPQYEQIMEEFTIAELNHHGWVMDMLGCERSYYNPINIHINCTKGELSDIAARFMSNLNKCEQSVTSRLVVENEDKGCWTVANLLEHFNIPVTYDNLHDKCNPSQFL